MEKNQEKEIKKKASTIMKLGRMAGMSDKNIALTSCATARALGASDSQIYNLLKVRNSQGENILPAEEYRKIRMEELKSRGKIWK